MEKAPPSNVSNGSAELTKERLPYHRPVLQFHGALVDLTRSTGSQNGDGGQNMRIP